MNIYLTLLVLSLALSLLGLFWLVIVAFKRSVAWGLLVLLFSPISAIVFSLSNWFDARKAFIAYMLTFLLFGGTLVFIIGQLGVGNAQQIATRLHTGKLKPGQAYQLINKVLREGNTDNLFAEDSSADVATASEVKPAAEHVTASPGKPDVQLAQNQTQTVAEPKLAAASKPVAPDPRAVQPAVAKAKPEIKPKTKPVSEVSTGKAATDDPADPDTDSTDQSDGPPSLSKVPPDPLQQKTKVEPKTVAVSLGRISRYIGRYFIITLKSGSEHRGILRKVSKTRLNIERELYGGKFIYRIRKDEIRSIRMWKNTPPEDQ